MNRRRFIATSSAALGSACFEIGPGDGDAVSRTIGGDDDPSTLPTTGSRPAASESRDGNVVRTFAVIDGVLRTVRWSRPSGATSLSVQGAQLVLETSDQGRHVFERDDATGHAAHLVRSVLGPSVWEEARTG